MARTIATILLLAGLLTAFTASAAHADYRDLILDACRTDERVDGTYSQKDYREALANLSDDQLQYTDCEAILRAAQRASARAQSGNGARASAIDNLIAGAGGDPLASATPAERAVVEKAVKQAEKTGGGPVSVGGEVVEPSSLGAGAVASSASDLPAPLLAALVLALIGAIAIAAYELVPRVRARRG